MLDLKEFLKAGVHFGHKSSRWSPKMRHFIWGSKNKVHLIDVSKTAFLLQRSGKYLKKLASAGKSFLWIGTKKPAQNIITKIATDLNMPFVSNRWIGGTLTNFGQIKKAIKKYLYLKDVIAKTHTNYTKKEMSDLQKEIARLEKKIGGIIDLDFPPAAIVLVDAKKEFSAIREAINAKIPIVAMVDTNTNPEGINFVIPANDDSPRSIKLIMNYLQTCTQEGKEEYKKIKAKEEKEKQEKKKQTTTKAPVKKEAATSEVKAPVKKETAKAEVKAPVKKEAATSEVKAPIKKEVEKKVTVKKETTKEKTVKKEAITAKKKTTKKAVSKTTSKNKK